MNIWLPIITNVIIALIVIAGIFVGKKNGFALEFGKLILLAGATIGCYFLLPVVTPLLLKIEFINELMVLPYSKAILNSITLLILFILSYLLISIICKLIANHSLQERDSINMAKPIKVRGLDRKQSRALRKEQKRLRKLMNLFLDSPISLMNTKKQVKKAKNSLKVIKVWILISQKSSIRLMKIQKDILKLLATAWKNILKASKMQQRIYQSNLQMQL